MTQTSTSPPYATPSPTLRTPAYASSVRYPPLRLPIRHISRSDLRYARLVRVRLRISNHIFGARSEVQCFCVLLRWLGPLFKKTVADSNAPVQEKALDALLAFQRAADADASRCVPSAAKSFPFMLLIICHLQRFMECWLLSDTRRRFVMQSWPSASLADQRLSRKLKLHSSYGWNWRQQRSSL